MRTILIKAHVNNKIMSSRAVRRLQRDKDIIVVPEIADVDDDDNSLNDIDVRSDKKHKTKKKQKAFNLFAQLDVEDDTLEGIDGDEEDMSNAVESTVTTSKAKKKKKKKRKPHVDERHCSVENDDDIDGAISEMSKYYGDDETVHVKDSKHSYASRVALLTVDRRFLNGDNEMKRIFGSKVVKLAQSKQRGHNKNYHRASVMVTPRDTWPRLEKLGLSMQLAESKGSCQCFIIEHSLAYQQVQCLFWEAVDSLDHHNIASVLNMYPYHIDSLVQLSEVCKMSEDLPMAAELIERAVYCLECNFHPLFNYTQANCKLDYSQQENRSLFITLFKHLNFVDSRGCHRTALEFCKLLLGLDPDNDPLCVLLMIDYFALRAGEYKFLTRLCEEWESHRNLSQLPNFAFSLPLALFHDAQDDKGFDDGTMAPCSEADHKLQDALIMFPSVLVPLLDKCGVIMPSSIVKHSFFQCPESRNPDALNLLVKLFIERNFSLWKVPEVLSWLEVNCNEAIRRIDSRDPLVAECSKQRQSRYRGTPRNIYRHIIISDYDQVKATLPKDISSEAIMMYDPLPPLDNRAAYNKPARTHHRAISNENSLSLFLRSLLPSFNVENEEETDQNGASASLGQAVDYMSESIQQLLRQLRSGLDPNDNRNDQDGNRNNQDGNRNDQDGNRNNQDGNNSNQEL